MVLTTYKEKEKYARKRGNIITFKSKIRSFNSLYKQLLIESVTKYRDGRVEVNGFGGLIIFDNMKQYLDNIDWEFIRRNRGK